MEREKLGSRLGFILISAGCAIGIGNVWKFPYVAGQYGGGVFLFFYLIFLVLLGIPVMTMEFASGRAAGTSPARLLKRLEPEHTRWHWYTPCILAGNWLLMMFYTVVTGWMLRYFCDMVTGQFVNATQAQISEHYTGMLSDAGSLILFTVLVVITGFGICARGLQAGLEKATKWMMGALLVMMVILAANSLLSAGAAEGVRYLFVPDIARAREIGLGSVIAAAMNQAFFTLSLGIGAMAIFGSYIGKDRRLFGESLNVAVLDTFVALTAALIVIPSCFAYGVETAAGPGLIFVTLPNIFAAMPLGRLWGGAVLPVSELCGVFHDSGRLREHHLQHHGPHRLDPEKDLSDLCRSDDCALAALCPGLQPAGWGAASGRRVHDHGPGGFPCVQYPAAPGIPGVCALLHLETGLGMGQLPEGSQHRSGTAVSRLEPRLLQISAPGDHCRDSDHRHSPRLSLPMGLRPVAGHHE